MRNPILKCLYALAAFLPAVAGPQPLVAQREGSWEFTGSGGILILDHKLLDLLSSGPLNTRYTTKGDPSRIAPLGAIRVGYNFTNNLGFSLGASGAKGSGVSYLTPFGAVTYTFNLNAKTSPFLTGGLQGTRIVGKNGNKTHPTWGAHLGAGIRSMVSERVALRLEGRVGFEHYAELPASKTAYNSVATIGLSYFAGGPARDSDNDGVPDKRDHCPNTAADSPVDRNGCPPPPCPVCAISTGAAPAPAPAAPAPPAPAPPRRCEHGIAPPGAEVDEFGCLVLRDTLLLEGVNFDFDKSELTSTATPILDRVAESMLAHPEVFFEIAGHTDSVGTFAYNFLLSARRAEAVRNYLIERGVPAGRMTAVGYGENLAIAPNATVEGRALNRRAVQLRVKRP